MNRRSIRFRLTMWYAGLLAGALLVFGTATYLGLQRYLKTSLQDSLTKEARSIAGALIVNIQQSGDAYVVNEINEHYAPEINGQLVRVARADGSLLFVSGMPKDGSFDPTRVPREQAPKHELSHEVAPSGGGEELLVHVLPFTTREGQQFLIEVGAPYHEVERVLHGLLLTFALGLPLVVALAIGGGYLLMRKALRPVDEITGAAERITSRNLSERLPVVHTGDELERLSVALNGMIERLDEAFQQMNRFAADASHELRTPLTVLHGELEAIVGKREVTPDIRETIATALEETQRLTRIVEMLLTIARLEAGEARMEPVQLDLAELTRSTAEQMGLLAEEKHIVLLCNVAKSVEVKGDRARLKQVVVNLLDNAIKYTPEGGRVEVGVTSRDGHAVLEVSDTGHGIPADDLPHVFERFYRADKARTRQMGGTGLGLSIVRSICTANGGTVKVTSREGAGTLFTVDLPLA